MHCNTPLPTASWSHGSLRRLGLGLVGHVYKASDIRFRRLNALSFLPLLMLPVILPLEYIARTPVSVDAQRVALIAIEVFLRTSTSTRARSEAPWIDY